MALQEGKPPTPKLVFRVGVTGHLEIPERTSRDISAVIDEVLKQIAGEVEKIGDDFAASFASKSSDPPEVRLLTQLAAGVDQEVGAVAVQRGYRVHGVLPFHKEAFQRNIQNSVGQDKARENFDQLIRNPAVIALFELPGDDATRESQDQAYAEANRVILSHSDLLIVMVLRNAPFRYGGSVWLEQRAFDQRVPVIHIPLDAPYEAELVWSRSGKQYRERLFHAGSVELDNARIGILLKGILTTEDRQPPVSRLTGLFLDRVPSFGGWDYFSEEITERWEGSEDDRIVIRALGDAPQRIDASFLGAYCWADHLARGYGKIYRAAFFAATMLGITAVIAAVLAGALGKNHEYAATALKGIEFFVMLAVLGLYVREKRMLWRIRWLNYRQLAEQFRHARYLLLLGRAIPVDVPAYMQEFHEDSDWTNWYVRAFMRQAGLPNARIDRDYLEAVRWLLETRQVDYQYKYYSQACKSQETTDGRLELTIGLLVWAVLIVLFLYLASYGLAAWLSPTKWMDEVELFMPAVAAISAILPAIAAALSAIKSHGEYAQNALRYHGMAITLRELRSELAEQRGALNGDLTRAYNGIAKLGISTSAYLLQEVYQWRTILQMKELERT